MAIKINDNCMTLEINGKAISQARRRPDHWWEVDYWPRFFRRNQANHCPFDHRAAVGRSRQRQSASRVAPKGARMTDKLIRGHHRPGGRCCRGGGGDHLLPACLRPGEYARRDRADGAADPVHRGRAHPGGEHADPGCQPPEPALARSRLGAGITATVGANLAHGLGHGPIGALVSAWPALALAGFLRAADDPDPDREGGGR
jgi:hypothetical protein